MWQTMRRTAAGAFAPVRRQHPRVPQWIPSHKSQRAEAVGTSGTANRGEGPPRWVVEGLINQPHCSLICFEETYVGITTLFKRSCRVFSIPAIGLTLALPCPSRRLSHVAATLGDEHAAERADDGAYEADDRDNDGGIHAASVSRHRSTRTCTRRRTDEYGEIGCGELPVSHLLGHIGMFGIVQVVHNIIKDHDLRAWRPQVHSRGIKGIDFPPAAIVKYYETSVILDLVDIFDRRRAQTIHMKREFAERYSLRGSK